MEYVVHQDVVDILTAYDIDLFIPFPACPREGVKLLYLTFRNRREICLDYIVWHIGWVLSFQEGYDIAYAQFLPFEKDGGGVNFPREGKG